MALLRKGWRERHCGVKLRYDNRRAATTALAKMTHSSRHYQRPIPALQAYHCRICSYWHLGGAQPKEGDAS